MAFHNIEKTSVAYSILYCYVKFWYKKVFYRKVVIINYEKVPDHGSLIFTPNHQNALMDALAVLFAVKKQLVFMARSDIFKKFAPILYFLKILPVYRIRDGINTLKKNQAVFDKTVDVLNANNGLVILPEGNHKGERRLRQLKKGFARIAFQTEKQGAITSGIQIIPMGIDYDDYVHCRSRQIVNFGSPIDVSGYVNDFKENPAIGLNKIKNRLAEAMKPLIIHIKSEPYYSLIDNLRVLFRRDVCLKLNMNPKDDADGFLADQRFVEMMDDAIETTQESVLELDKNYKKIKKILENVNLTLFDMKNHSAVSNFLFKALALLITFPFFLYGYINHFLPFCLPKLITKNVKDEMFITSFLFVLTLISFPLFYLLQSLVIYFLFNSWWITLGYFLTLPLFAIAAWKWKNLFLSAVTDFRKIKFYKTKQFAETTRLFDNIHKITNSLMDRYL